MKFSKLVFFATNEPETISKQKNEKLNVVINLFRRISFVLFFIFMLCCIILSFCNFNKWYFWGIYILSLILFLILIFYGIGREKDDIFEPLAAFGAMDFILLFFLYFFSKDFLEALLCKITLAILCLGLSILISVVGFCLED